MEGADQFGLEIEGKNLKFFTADFADDADGREGEFTIEARGALGDAEGNTG